MNRETWALMHEGPFFMAADLPITIEECPIVAFLCQNCGAIFVERFQV